MKMRTSQHHKQLDDYFKRYMYSGVVALTTGSIGKEMKMLSKKSTCLRYVSVVACGVPLGCEELREASVY